MLKMFAFRRIIRTQFSLKINIHTSNIRCDKPKNSEPKENKLNSNKKKSTKISEDKLVGNNASKKKLTAELNANDYAKFKSKKYPKVELYSDKSSEEEKLEAKAALQVLSKEIENEINVDTPLNENLKTIAVTKSKGIPKKGSKNKLIESVKAVAVELGGDAKGTEGDILGYLKALQLKTEKRKLKQGIDENMDAEEFRYFKDNKGKHLKVGNQGIIKDRRTYSGRFQEQDVDHSYKLKQDSQLFLNERSQPSRGQIQREAKIADVILNQRHSGFQPLRIFEAADLKDDHEKLKIWEELEELELKVAATVPPRNHFEELIQWTKEGKLWHFPIDNDQGNDTEANIDFTEHVFLEEYLEPWCPKKGPLRHFMELVLTGLAKNYHLTVEEKKEHIYWYRDYFESKKKLLQDMGALDNVKVLQSSAETNSKPENLT